MRGKLGWGGDRAIETEERVSTEGATGTSAYALGMIGTGEADWAGVDVPAEDLERGGDLGGGVGGIFEGSADTSCPSARSKASRASAFWIALSTFLDSDDGVVLWPEIVEDRGRGGKSETTEVSAGRKAGYVIWLAVSVLVADDSELRLLTLDLALERELASCDSFDFFSPLLLAALRRLPELFKLGRGFSLFMLPFSSAAAFIDFLVPRDTWDGPSGMSGRPSIGGSSITVGGRELSSDDGEDQLNRGGPSGERNPSIDKRTSAEGEGDGGIWFGSGGKCECSSCDGNKVHRQAVRAIQSSAHSPMTCP